MVGLSKFESVGEYVEYSKFWLGLFEDKDWGCEYEFVERIEEGDYIESLNDGEEGKMRFCVNLMNNEKEYGKGMVLVSFSVEYDVSWVVMGEEDWKEFKRVVKEECEKVGE